MTYKDCNLKKLKYFITDRGKCPSLACHRLTYETAFVTTGKETRMEEDLLGKEK